MEGYETMDPPQLDLEQVYDDCVPSQPSSLELTASYDDIIPKSTSPSPNTSGGHSHRNLEPFRNLDAFSASYDDIVLSPPGRSLDLSASYDNVHSAGRNSFSPPLRTGASLDFSASYDDIVPATASSPGGSRHTHPLALPPRANPQGDVAQQLLSGGGVSTPPLPPNKPGSSGGQGSTKPRPQVPRKPPKPAIPAKKPAVSRKPVPPTQSKPLRVANGQTPPSSQSINPVSRKPLVPKKPISPQCS